MATNKTRAKKFFIGVKDGRFEDRRQSSVLSILTDGDELYINQYGKMFTESELGSFDVLKRNINNETEAVLEFYPIDGRINEYSYSFISYDLKQNIFDYDKYEFGNTVSVASTYSLVSSGVQKIIYSIPQEFTSAKILVEISSEEENHYEYNELNVIRNGSDVYYSEYGRITLSNNSSIREYGIGEYDFSYSNSNLNLSFNPNTTENLNFNIVSVSLANTDFTAFGSRVLRYGTVESGNISIAATSEPQPVAISSYSSNYNLNYFVVQITDTTNNEIQLSEVIILNNDIESTIIDYGNVYSNTSLGTFNSSSSSVTELLFTPNPDIDVSITLLAHSISYLEFLSFPLSLNFKNAELTTGVSKFEYSGDIAFKKEFDLTHKLIPIFERRFNGGTEYTSESLSGVDLNRNLIYIPNHFFVSGEGVRYRSETFYYLTILSTQTTETAGVGTNGLNILSTIGLSPGDYFEVNDNYIPIISISGNKVFLSTNLSSQINSRTPINFSRLFDINYGSEDSPTISSIEISETNISGVGNTDKLSGNLYVYKHDDRFIGLCASPSDALSNPPNLINFTSVGIGNNHYLTSTNQNAKCAILIDNIIQSPIVSTSTTSLLLDDIQLSDTTLYFSNIDSFFSGDIIKVDDEIMRISSVGVGSTNFVEVTRSFLGSNLNFHNSNSLITKLNGNYNIVGSKIYFSDAPYGPIYDEVNGNINIRSSFQGRVFLRSGVSEENMETYEKNYIFDDISNSFDTSTKDFTLKSNGQDISGFSTSNSIILINNIFQNPEDDYELSESSSQTQINFTGSATSVSYDPNNASIPRGGIIVSIGSSSGFGYQPLISAGGTAVVSASGTIQSISIGNSGSGYRSGLQPFINVGVQTLSSGIPNIEFIGTASVSNGHIVSISITNAGSGYTSSNPPLVVFDDPLPYSNLNLIHTESSSGIGSNAKIDIVVGQGSSIIDFNITNYGYSYNVGDILTIENGGSSSIPLDSSKSFERFTIIVDRVYKDNFSGWSIGELQKLDDIDYLFDDNRTVFPLYYAGERYAIISRPGSKVDVKSTLLIFLNDVLQEPGVSYNLIGGSLISFTEPPSSGSKCKIIFYKGTPEIDVVETDIIETIKPGDRVQIIGNQDKLIQNTRIGEDIILPDTLETNSYNSIGISNDIKLLRPVEWCRQRDDILIDGKEVFKSRVNYEPNIFPVCNIIQSVGIGSTQIFVDSIKTIFDSVSENVSDNVTDKIEIIDNKDLVSATAVAIVSSSGEISSISILDGGKGYTSAPEVYIQNPIGIGESGKAVLDSSISSGSVNSISVISPGFGYTTSNPPLILIEPPVVNKEIIGNVAYFGDFGIITGVATTSVDVATTGLILDLYIPPDSYLRNSFITNPTISESVIKEDYYFKVFDSTIGEGTISKRKDGSIIGIGTTGIDNVYQVISVSYANTGVYGGGNDSVVKVTISISSYSGITGFGNSSYYGKYSWGLINTPEIKNSYSVNTDYGVVGLNSTPIVRRYESLRYLNYNDI